MEIRKDKRALHRKFFGDLSDRICFPDPDLEFLFLIWMKSITGSTPAGKCFEVVMETPKSSENVILEVVRYLPDSLYCGTIGSFEEAFVFLFRADQILEVSQKVLPSEKIFSFAPLITSKGAITFDYDSISDTEPQFSVSGRGVYEDIPKNLKYKFPQGIVFDERQ